ncbi:hypothetical protein NCC49_005720 [Naganishia albida]|nr:hypothetical protein NCC49_005720 [Naganishia albida]
MYPRPGTIIVPRVADQFDVLTALGAEQRNQRGRIRPEYATAIFTAYIQNKLQKGRTRFEVSLKVQDLERGLPHLANSFAEARRVTGLPPSPLWPSPSSSSAARPEPAVSTSQLALLRTQSAYHAPHRQGTTTASSTSPSMRRASTATMRSPAPVTRTVPSTVRVAEETSEPPPPPYSRTDPEPEATAELQRQLSRLSTGGATGLPLSPSTPAERQRTFSSEETAGGDERAAERERREFEEALRLSRESAEEEEALRLSRESAAAEEAAREAREAEQSFSSGTQTSSSSSHATSHQPVPGSYPSSSSAPPPPLPPRSSLLMDDHPAPGLAAPLQPIPTGSNNPFASALDPVIVSPTHGTSSHAVTVQQQQQRYAPPPGPPPGHPASRGQETYTPPPGPPPGRSRNPFADPASVPPEQQPPSHTLPHPMKHAAPAFGNAAGTLPDLSILARYDTLLLIDDSGSMAGARWTHLRQALMDVVQRIVGAQESAAASMAGNAAGGGADGVQIAFLNSAVEGFNLTTPSSVEKLFNKVKPTNGTPTGAALRRILEPYMTQLEHVQPLKSQGERIPVGEDVKPMNVIVLTDGAATDDPESVIVSIASRLDQGGFPLDQVGIQFLQIGNEAEAREALQVLDDAIKERHEVRDIVDTVVYDGQAVSAEQIIKVLLGGIQKHLDGREVARGEHALV